MSGKWGGRKVAKYKRLVIAAYGTKCWWCREVIDLSLPNPHPLSFSIEHLVHRSTAPWLADDLSNMRPAHLAENTSRGNRASPTARASPTGRTRRQPETGPGF